MSTDDNGDLTVERIRAIYAKLVTDLAQAERDLHTVIPANSDTTQRLVNFGMSLLASGYIANAVKEAAAITREERRAAGLPL